MTKDGLYLTHGADKHALVIIREANGTILWIRDFVTVEAALDILEDDVLSRHNRANILHILAGNRGFYTDLVIEPEDGFSSCALRRYVLTPSN